MKTILFVALASLAFNSFAAESCPVLKGTYVKCTSGSRMSDQMMGVSPNLTIKQTPENVFTITDDKEVTKVVVGGKVLTSSTNEGMKVKLEVTAKCSPDSLILSYKVTEVAYAYGRAVGSDEELELEIVKDTFNTYRPSFQLNGSKLTIDNGLAPVVCTKK